MSVRVAHQPFSVGAPHDPRRSHVVGAQLITRDARWTAIVQQLKVWGHLGRVHRHDIDRNIVEPIELDLFKPMVE